VGKKIDLGGKNGIYIYIKKRGRKIFGGVQSGHDGRCL
jgi:hypothetical protein